MITPVLALIFYAVDPVLGVVIAVVMPSVVAMDSNGDYSEVLLVVFLAVAFFFVRRAAINDLEEQ